MSTGKCWHCGSVGLDSDHLDPRMMDTRRCYMARKDALLRLTSRLIARRDALRKALNGDLDSFRKFSELSVVGDNVDAAVDSANDEICSQLVEIESRELGQIEHALAADRRRGLRPLRILRRQDLGSPAQRPALHEYLHRLPARERAGRPVESCSSPTRSGGRRSTKSPTTKARATRRSTSAISRWISARPAAERAGRSHRSDQNRRSRPGGLFFAGCDDRRRVSRQRSSRSVAVGTSL